MRESQLPKAKIERSKLDGTERTLFIKDTVHWPNGLAIDYENELLYWADAYFDRIDRARFDGSARMVRKMLILDSVIPDWASGPSKKPLQIVLYSPIFGYTGFLIYHVFDC